jgi:hypothetical protein
MGTLREANEPDEWCFLVEDRALPPRAAEVSVRLEDRRGLEVRASAATAKTKQMSGRTKRIKYLGFTNESCAPHGDFLTLCSLFIRYDGVVGNTRTCVVSFTDSDGVRHSVEVAAESLYEAAAAVAEFRRHAWVDDQEPGTTTKLAISVKPPATTHEVSIRQLEKWTATTAKSPHETLLKSRVRALLDRKP